MSRAEWTAVIALLTISFLWAGEESYDGAGLQWAALWCFFGGVTAGRRLLVYCVAAKSAPSSTVDAVPRPAAAIRWCVADMSWILIACGQWVSTGVLFSKGGDRRSALNLSMEWLGLLTAWFLIRMGFSSGSGRRAIACLLVATGSGLSAYGIWQHHFQYAQHAAWYQGLRNELDLLLERPDAASSLRASELSRELRDAHVPLSGAERFLWEQRLLNSSEPTATFALANTLAGILAVSLLIIAGSVRDFAGNVQRVQWKQLIVLLLCAALLSYCLVLTKSRTAWIGCLAGCGLLLLHRGRRHVQQATRRLLIVGTMIAGAAVMAGIWWGALDREVILESPRSLQFRGMYWLGTIRMVRESPLVGIGPGNFRQSYLAHKLPESSEEIRDPHNLVLEAWSSGGLMGLTGVLGCGFWICGGRRRRELDIADGQFFPSLPDRDCADAGSRRLTTAVGAGFLLYGGWQWLHGAEFGKEDLPWLLIPAAAIGLCTIGLDKLVRLTPATAQAAAVALLIHLMGAGGFEVSAVMLCLAVCLAAAADESVNTSEKSTDAVKPGARRYLWPFGCVTGIPLILCLLVALFGVYVTTLYGVLPVNRVRQLTASGRQYQSLGDWRSAAIAFHNAAVADPWTVIPRQRLAELETYKLMMFTQLPRKEERRVRIQLDAAAGACNEWLRADPRNPAAFRLRASGYSYASQLISEGPYLKLAIEDQRTVTERYPGSAADWWRLAELERMADMEQNVPIKPRTATMDAAREALRLDQINRSWGHVDRFLTDAQVATLDALVAGEFEQ